MDHSSAAYHFGQIIGVLLGLAVLLAVPVAFFAGLIMLIKTRSKAWLFLLIPSGLLGFAFVAFVGGSFMFGVAKGIREAQKSADTTTLTSGLSSDSLISVKYPASWKTLTKLNEDAQLQLGSSRREEYLLVFNESKADFGGTLADYGSIVSGNLRKVLADAEVSDPEMLTINGLNALRYQISGKLKGLNLEYFLTVVESPNHFHQVMMWTLKSKKEAAFPVFEQVASTFELAPDAK